MMRKSGHAGKSFSKGQHSFSTAETGITRSRSSFDRPSRTISAIDANFIYPVLVDEVLPGDTYQLRGQIQAWLATPLLPFLDNLYATIHYFFTPNRLVWENWQRFQGEKDDPGDTTEYTVPQISIAGGSTAGEGLLADYMGIPTIATTLEVNAMPFRAYNLIYNEYYRDTALQDSLVVDIDDANSTESDYVLKKRGRRKDYLTGCLPWPQRGDTVDLPLGTSAPVVLDSQTVVAFGSGVSPPLFKTTNAATTYNLSMPTVGAPDLEMSIDLQGGVGNAADEEMLWDATRLTTQMSGVTGVADLSTATAATINQLRQSIAIQQLLELDARAGSRYTEQLKARWGVTSADSRLQRPEYLGGSTINISVTPVPTTSESSGNVGALAAFGNARGPVGGFTHSFTEHGYVMALISLRSDYTYSEGVQRHWKRETRYDYFEPSLAHLGEQPVYNGEIFISNVDVDDYGDAAVFGYQERFSEYKYGNSMCTGIMRPNATNEISQWHLGEEFVTAPTLNDAFIQDNTPIDRVIAVTSEPHLLFDLYFANRTTRVMPVHNTPGLRRL